MDPASFLFGSEEKLKKVSNLNKGQGQFLDQLMKMIQGMSGEGGGYSQAMGLLQDYLNPQSEVYQNFEKPYLRQFNEQTIPGLAERFAGMGAQGGALSSSGFGQALSSAGAGLQENLAQMKSGMQRSAAGDIMGQFNQLAGLGLGTQPFSYYQQPASAGLLNTGVSSFMKGLGGSFGFGG